MKPMQLKYFLQILEQEDPNLEILFDVKAVESMQDCAHLSDIYDDGNAIIIELR
jgi:hypothetical protein